MYKARYYKADGKKGKARALPDSLFDGVVNEGVMHQAVTAYLNNQRQGTAAAKTRSDVRGGSRKPWRQKGTGRARAGTTRASQWVGGGVAFPPIPHSWRQRIPKKVRALARRSALNDRAENDRVVLADVPSFEAPKTRDLLGFLASIDVPGKVLLLTDGNNTNVYLSARNLSDVSVLPFGDESVYDVLWAHTIVIERSAIDAGAKKKPAAKAAEPEAEAEAPETAEVADAEPAQAAAVETAPEADATETEDAEAEAEAEEGSEVEASESVEADADVAEVEVADDEEQVTAADDEGAVEAEASEPANADASEADEADDAEDTEEAENA
jgi:large subunit ribosomal protein L4